MVLDTLDHLATYSALPGIDRITDFLQSHDLEQMAEGTYQIDGDRLYVMVQKPSLRKRDGALAEAHRLYADLQVVLEGEEIMGWAPLDTLGAPVEDPEGRDIAFYSGDFTYFRVPAGSFAIFYPQDAHAPGIGRHEGDTDRKAVFKIRLPES